MMTPGALQGDAQKFEALEDISRDIKKLDEVSGFLRQELVASGYRIEHACRWGCVRIEQRMWVKVA